MSYTRESNIWTDSKLLMFVCVLQDDCEVKNTESIKVWFNKKTKLPFLLIGRKTCMLI